jgi:hypothetical protein
VEKKSGLFRPLKHGGIGGMKQAVHHDGEDACVRCDHPCAQQTKAAWVDSPEVGSNQIASKMNGDTGLRIGENVHHAKFGDGVMDIFFSGRNAALLVTIVRHKMLCAKLVFFCNIFGPFLKVVEDFLDIGLSFGQYRSASCH